MTAGRENFDTVARNHAEVIDLILSAPHSRARRIELITYQIRRTLILGYRAAKAKQNNAGDGIKSEPEG
jgi:hypothetical protein